MFAKKYAVSVDVLELEPWGAAENQQNYIPPSTKWKECTRYADYTEGSDLQYKYTT